MRTRHATALIALLLSGCGGGGSDTAVSANPPAAPAPPSPAPATPQPAPAPPPRVDGPAPVQIPPPAGKPPVAAPVPAPEPAPTPSPEPPAPQPAPPPVPPAPAPAPGISGAVLYKALRTTAPDYNPTGTPWVGESTTVPESYFTVYILAGSSRTWPTPTYISSAWPFSTSQLPEMGLFSTWLDGIGPTLRTTYGDMLERPEAFLINQGAQYPLDTTLATWAAQNPADPWYAKFMLQTDSRSNTVFRVCWDARLPQVIRLWCTKHDRLTGDFRGIYVVDDSLGLGAHTWETR